MHLAQVVTGGFFMAIAFGLLFIPTFESVIQVCVLGNPQLYTMAGAVGYLSTCDEQIERLTEGFSMPMLAIFLGLVMPAAWLLFTGMQSRSLVGVKHRS